MPPRRLSALFALSLACAPALASAQPVATMSWQLQPFCNRVTITINREGAVYTLDGFDDQCGAPQRAPLVGTAVPNSDGTISLGFTLTVPPARALQIDGRVSAATGSGTWTDSAGNGGTFALNGSGGVAVRPPPSAGPSWGTVVRRPETAGDADGLRVVVPASVSSAGSALVGQLGDVPAAMPSAPAAVLGVSADQTAVMGSSGSSTGVAGTSTLSVGVAGESSSGPGVFGLSFTGPGVVAFNGGTGTGVALEVRNGALQVTGPVTPAFVFTASPTNTAGHITTLDHPLLNGAPDAMVFVTRVWGGAGGSTANILSPLSVLYIGNRWAIFREDGAAIPLNTRFNVLVISR